MIRRILDGLYLISGYLAALFIVGICVSIMVQMASRFMGITFDATELAGFCLAASTFFGLAYTLRTGGHVRITLLLDRLPLRLRRGIEVLNCLIAGTAITFLAWHVVGLALQSFRYHDVSPGLLAIPFWIPQAGAAIGVIVFAIALFDAMIALLRGHRPDYDTADDPGAAHYE